MLCSRVWSRFRRPAAFVSLSLSRTFEDARREKNVVVAGFFVALVRIEPEERRRTTLEERQRCRSCVNVPIQTNNKKLTLIFRRFSNYSRAEKTNRDGLNRAQPDVARPGVQGENDGAEEILRETEHGRRPGGRDDGGHGDHAGATRSAGGFGKLPR